MKYFITKNHELINVTEDEYYVWLNTGADYQIMPEWSHKVNKKCYKMEVRFNGINDEEKEFKPFLIYLYSNNFGMEIGDNGHHASSFEFYCFEDEDKLINKYLKIMDELAPD